MSACETDREVFERVRGAMLAMDGPSWVDGDGCQYRGEDGRRCAVGCLIPDPVYTPDIEGGGIASLDVTTGRWEGAGVCHFQIDRLAAALNASGVPARQETRSLLYALQAEHDRAAVVGTWGSDGEIEGRRTQQWREFQQRLSAVDLDDHFDPTGAFLGNDFLHRPCE